MYWPELNLTKIIGDSGEKWNFFDLMSVCAISHIMKGSDGPRLGF